MQAFGEASGNAGLAGRELPPADVLAADARLTALAKWLQARGAAGHGQPAARRRLHRPAQRPPLTSLLDDRPLPATLPAHDSPVPGEAEISDDAAARERRRRPDARSARRRHGRCLRCADAGATPPAGPTRPWADCPPVSGTIHLTMPLSAFARRRRAGRGRRPRPGRRRHQPPGRGDARGQRGDPVVPDGHRRRTAAPPGTPAPAAARRPGSRSSPGPPGCAPGCSCWRPGPAATPARPPATCRRGRCGTWSRSGSGPAPSPAAAAPPPAATWTTPCPTTRAAGPANATSPRSADGTIRPSRHPAGTSTSPSPAR